MARRTDILVLAACMGCTLACVGTLVAAEPPAPAAVDRRGVDLLFGGKLGPDDLKFREGFQAFRLRFGRGDWSGTTVQVTSVWGDAEGKDLWGWVGGSPAEWSAVLHDDQGDYFILYLNPAGSSHQVVALFRYLLKDGTFGVAAALFPLQGESKSGAGNAATGKPAPSGAAPAVDRRGVALSFDGKLGPDDPKFRKEFEAFRLRFGPGDWAETAMQVTSVWGDSEGKDLWGWINGPPAEWSPTFRDDRGDYFILYLQSGGSSHRLIAAFRYLLKDGTFGVAKVSLPYHDEPKAGAGAIAAAAPAPGAKVQAAFEKDLARSRLTVIPAGAAGGSRAVVALARPASSADVADEGGRFQPLLRAS